MYHLFPKVLLGLVLVFVVSSSSQAQLIQTGQVRELNSGKKPVSGAQIIFEGAVPATSDQAGQFRLAFQDKEPGQWVFLSEVRKAGFDLVNLREIEQLKLSNSQRLGTDIILARAGIVDAAKMQYYAISDQALRQGFEQEKKRLRAELQAAKLSGQQYGEKYDQLQERFERQQKELDRLAEKFARVNFDDVSPVYQEALELFKVGQIEQAIQRLEGADLTQRTEQILQEEDRLIQAQQEIDAQKAALEEEKQQQIEAIQLLAEFYLLQFEIVKAEAQYDQLLQLDPDDLEILQGSADFYRTQHRYAKALRWYPKIVAHPDAGVIQVANAFNYLGDVYMLTGKLDSALQVYRGSLLVYDRLQQENPEYAFYQENLAIAYSKVGDSYFASGDLDSSMWYYQESVEWMEKLQRKHSEVGRYTHALAATYSKVGDAYYKIGNLKEALTYYKKATFLIDQLLDANPRELPFYNSLSTSFSKLGDTHGSLGQLDSAIYYFEARLRLNKSLVNMFPKHVPFRSSEANAFSRLGRTYIVVGRPGKALELFQEGNLKWQRLVQDFPDNIRFKDGLGTSYFRLGEVYTAYRQLDSALYYFEQYKATYEALHAFNPENAEHDHAVGIAFLKLGETYSWMGDMEMALSNFEQGNQWLKQVVKTYPNNVEYKGSLANSYAQLWESYSFKKELESGLKAIQSATAIYQDLIVMAPDKLEFKKGLAVSYSRTGDSFRALQVNDSSLHYFLKETQLFDRLHKAYPTDPYLQNSLTVSYSKLATLYLDLGLTDAGANYLNEMVYLAEDLYESYPDNLHFKNWVALSYAKMGGLYRDHVWDYKKAVSYYDRAIQLWREIVQAAPDVAEYRRYLGLVQEDRAKAKRAIWDDQAQLLEKEVEKVKLEKDRVGPQMDLVNLWEDAYEDMPNDDFVSYFLAAELGTLSWYLLFSEAFDLAEQAAGRGLTVDESQLWIATNFVSAMVFQGDFERAKPIYLELKDQMVDGKGTFREVFLEDLNTLEAAGITHPDVAQVRELLNEE